MSGSPQPFPGTCGPGYDDDVVCALVVNTTLYDPLFVPLGPPWEQMVSRGTQWFTVILSILMTGWFFYNMYTGHCGWEVIFVTIIEVSRPAMLQWSLTVAACLGNSLPEADSGATLRSRESSPTHFRKHVCSNRTR